MSEPEPTDVEKLLRLKRYEKPSEEFLDRFMAEFQDRQRSEMLRQSAHGLFFERLSTWAWGMGRWKWVYAGGAASALAISGGMFLKTEATAVAAQPQNENAGVEQAETELPKPAEPGAKVPSNEPRLIFTGGANTAGE
jgi:hypothetical protein